MFLRNIETKLITIPRAFYLYRQKLACTMRLIIKDFYLRIDSNIDI